MEEKKFVETLAALPTLPCPERVIQHVNETIKSEVKGKSFSIIKNRKHRFTLDWKSAALGVAIIIVFMISIQFPFRDKSTPTQTQYTEQDIRKAKKALKWSLVYMAQKIKKSEKTVVEETLYDFLPKTVSNSIRKIIPILKGGEK